MMEDSKFNVPQEKIQRVNGTIKTADSRIKLTPEMAEEIERMKAEGKKEVKERYNKLPNEVNEEVNDKSQAAGA